MEEYFGVRYSFDKEKILSAIDTMVSTGRKGYVCVADGVTLAMSHRNKELKTALDVAGLTICDSGWVPLYLKFIYGIKRNQYCGSDLLADIVELKKYKLMFVGATEEILNALKNQLVQKDNNIASMEFVPLPFGSVDNFDYKTIAGAIQQADPDIIFVSLGMPKQELFMHNLSQYLGKGVMIGVGAAFKYQSGLAKNKRAPAWMIRAKTEWVYRICCEPKKQIKRCALIISTMPGIYLKEYKLKAQKPGGGIVCYPSEC